MAIRLLQHHHLSTLLLVRYSSSFTPSQSLQLDNVIINSIDEQFILNQLSELLPTLTIAKTAQKSTPESIKLTQEVLVVKRSETSRFDGHLVPGEALNANFTGKSCFDGNLTSKPSRESPNGNHVDRSIGKSSFGSHFTPKPTPESWDGTSIGISCFDGHLMVGQALNASSIENSCFSGHLVPQERLNANTLKMIIGKRCFNGHLITKPTSKSQNGNLSETCIKESHFDGHLSHEERFRGVFNDKLEGKAAIESVLLRENREMSLETLGEVLNIDSQHASISETSNEKGCFNRFLMSGKRVGGTFLPKIRGKAVVVSALQEKIVENVETLGGVEKGNSDGEVMVTTPIETSIERSRFDVHLTPEERLRGVFLHKLKGKAAIESALAVASRDVEINLETVGEVLNKGNLSGEAMVMFFSWAMKQVKKEEPTVEKPWKDDSVCSWYNVVIKALGRRKFFSYMEAVVREMKKQGVKGNDETVRIVIDSYVRATRVRTAIEFFGKLREFGFKCDTETLNVVLECLCMRCHVGFAKSFMSSMTGKGNILFDRRTWNLMIQGWAKLGLLREIEGGLKEMTLAGFSPDCLTFSYVIEGLGRTGRVEESVKVFKKLEEKGYVPDTVLYNALISNFASLEDFDKCMYLYKRMLEKRYAPDINTYKILISASLKMQRVADALELFNEMLDKRITPSTGMVTSFIEPLCSFGPPHAALMIYKDSRKVGCVLSMKAYKLLLKRLARFGKCGMIQIILDDMQECGYSLDMEIYEYIIDGHCEIGQLEHAALVLEEALSKGFCPNKIFYSKFNNRLLDAKKVEMAYRLFLKVKEARLRDNARRYWRSNGWHF